MNMTEWEKMLAGLPQNDRAPELEARRLVAKRLFRAYNKTTEEDIKVREEIMRQLFRSVGKNVFIEPDFICEMGNNITIGDNVFMNFGCIIFDMGEVTIGDNVMFGEKHRRIQARDDRRSRVGGGGRQDRAGRDDRRKQHHRRGQRGDARYSRKRHRGGEPVQGAPQDH